MFLYNKWCLEPLIGLIYTLEHRLAHLLSKKTPLFNFRKSFVFVTPQISKKPSVTCTTEGFYVRKLRYPQIQF